MPPRILDRHAAFSIEPIDRHVAARIEKTRKWRRLSRAKLAAAIGISEPQLTKLERAQNRLFIGRLYAIAMTLHVTPGWFFDEFDAGIADTIERPPSFRPPGLAVEEQTLVDDYRRLTDPQRRLVRQVVDQMVPAPAGDDPPMMMGDQVFADPANTAAPPRDGDL
ncbi:MAG: hypothetical protein RIR25_1088 [Verrucomicrobiota bacterium]|jgi:transcriptional regulator with XRE-family HTH domain